MPDVLLVIPPDYGYDFPPLGTPALAGFLKSRGVGASQLDLNIAYRDSWAQGAEAGGGLGAGDRAGRSVRERMNLWFDAKAAEGLYYSRHLPQNAGEYQYGVPYDNRTDSSFYFTERLLSDGSLSRYLEDEDENTFLRFCLHDRTARRLAADGPALVGVSVISPSQAVAALTLCRLLRREAPGLRVALGGQWASLYAERIMERPDWTGLFDFVVTGEGETPLLRLVEVLGSRGGAAAGSMRGVPNLIHHDGKAWTRNPLTSEEDLDLLPAPDFDGLPLSSYAGCADGRVTLTCETARGCYWNRCDYCVDLPLPKPSYRAKSADLAVRDIKALASKYRLGQLLVSNATMSPRQMREISERLVREDIAVSWWAMARLDDGFTREIFALAREAGCRQINFGFESASDRVCDSVRKGNRLEVTRRVIQDCHGAGIQVGLQTMFGLPGETLEEGLDTVQFIAENHRFIDHLAFNTYFLTPKCAIHGDPARWGLDVQGDDSLPFKFYTEFRQAGGAVSPSQAKGIRRLCATMWARRSVFLAEDHNEVLDIWRKFELSGLTLVHLDAHIDFGWVPEKDLSQILEARTSAELDELLASRPLWNPVATPKERLVDIGNFICPAMREGIVDRFCWVVPDGTLSSRKERGHVLRVLRGLTKAPVRRQVGTGNLLTELAGKETVVCTLDSLPRFAGPVLLDIDLDYLLTRGVTDDLSPDREPWIEPRALAERLSGLGLKAECTTLSYSVTGGFTPLRFRHLGDELRDRLLEAVPAALGGAGPRRQPDARPLPPAARHYGEALAGLARGEIAAASASLRKAVGLDPAYGTAYNNPGPVFEAMGRWDEAEKAYRDALALDPGHAFALCGLGNIRRERRDWAGAEGHYRRALELLPSLAEAHFGLGSVLFHGLGKPGEAAAEFRETLGLDPYAAAAHFKLGLIAMREGRGREALSSFKEARRLGLDTPELHWRLGRLLLGRRRYGKAGRELYRAARTALAAVIRR
ncbi:MAG: UPF0489 family protein [Elusimicrobia bacterium]|nr:UPF0489 family protein [Elusimicrobiota bacterium]